MWRSWATPLVHRVLFFFLPYLKVECYYFMLEFAEHLVLFCICVGGGVVAHVSGRKILSDGVRALQGYVPFYSFNNVDGLYVATGFVVVPLPDEIDDLTLLEATGCASSTKDGAEESAAKALIAAAKHDFGVVVNDFSFNEAEDLRKKNETLPRSNLLLSSGRAQSLDHLQVLQNTLETITLDAVGDCLSNSVGLLAHEAAMCAEENSWCGTTALEGAAADFMDAD